MEPTYHNVGPGVSIRLQRDRRGNDNGDSRSRAVWKQAQDSLTCSGSAEISVTPFHWDTARTKRMFFVDVPRKGRRKSSTCVVSVSSRRQLRAIYAQIEIDQMALLGKRI